jgi:hypothetical protein
MDIQFASTTSSNQQVNGTFGFRVVSSTSTYYKVNVNGSGQGAGSSGSFSYLFKVETTGTVDWAYVVVAGHGYNTTDPAQAGVAFAGAMAFFELEAGTNSVYSYALVAQYFHQVGGTNTIVLVNAATGESVSIDYQTYVPNSSTETFDFCGSSFSFTEFTVEIGTIHGSSVQVLVNFHLKGTVNGNSADATIKLSWVALEK